MRDCHRLEAPFADRPPRVCFGPILIFRPLRHYRRDLDPFAWAQETTVPLNSYGFYTRLLLVLRIIHPDKKKLIAFGLLLGCVAGASFAFSATPTKIFWSLSSSREYI